MKMDRRMEVLERNVSSYDKYEYNAENGPLYRLKRTRVT